MNADPTTPIWDIERDWNIGKLRTTQVYAQSERLTLADLLIADTVGVADDSLTRSTGDNATRLTLDGAVDGLKAGRWVIVEGQRSDEIGRASCRERVCQYV